jgi:membrane protease YdiL (CAAX protease family)
VLIGVAVAAALVVIVSVLGRGLDALWQAMGWPKTDAETFSKLIAFATNPLGALLVGIVAGVGEELAVRGVLQPRLGILISNVFFTALHALQYGWDALLVVFAVGIAMGVLRKRTSTTTSAIAHGTYDFILLMLAWAQVPGFGK